jgi:nucleoid DNA-binding protein
MEDIIYMLKKTEMIKDISKIGNISEKDALKYYDVVMKAISNGILKSSAVKIPDVGIIKIKEKKPRNIKVPKIDNKVSVPQRKGLTIIASDYIKYYLNK